MNVHAKPARPRAAAEPAPSPIAPDCAGQDFYAVDRGLRDLLELYLPADVRAKLPPHFKRLGVLAGGRLDQLARMADKHGPVLHPRDRFGPRRGLDRVPPRLSRDGGDRLRRLPVPRHEPSRRHARPRCAGDARRQVRLPVPVRAGRVRHHVPDQRHRHVDLPDPQVREPAAQGLPAAAHAVGRPGRAVEGHAVHDREGRRLRHRPGRDGGAERGRHLAALRREVVLLAHGRRRGADPRAPRGGAGRHQGARPVRAAAAARGRLAQQLPDRAAEGQARHALDGLGRDPARGRRRLSGRPARPGPQADDGAGQPVAPLARRAGRRHDAPLRQRGADRGAPSRRLRQAP